jgi:hypothetical protein
MCSCLDEDSAVIFWHSSPGWVFSATELPYQNPQCGERAMEPSGYHRHINLTEAAELRTLTFLLNFYPWNWSLRKWVLSEITTDKNNIRIQFAAKWLFRNEETNSKSLCFDECRVKLQLVKKKLLSLSVSESLTFGKHYGRIPDSTRSSLVRIPNTIGAVESFKVQRPMWNRNGLNTN